ncbi:MAG TPA: alanine dehydrogenase [Bacteroidales bacterium]|nr:alanine dehydrogenase [Bacteroidales bacterium]
MDSLQNPGNRPGVAEIFLPKEELLETNRPPIKHSIGLPAEASPTEKRIVIVPSAVSLLTENGHTVYMQQGAGSRANFSDEEYANAGARIMPTAEEVYQADIILKIASPVDKEMEYLHPRQILFSSVQPFTHCKDYFRKLISRKITAVAFEHLKDDSGAFPVLRAMSEIAGTTGILVAAGYLSHPEYGRGTMLGGFPGINPSEVVILGAGTVGEYAARTAIGMGALVKVFDNNIYKLRSIQHDLNSRIFTSILQPQVLLKSLKTADVLIGAIHTKNGRTPIVVTEEMVSQMKKGSVIIDISIDQGGCVETSSPTHHANPVFVKHGITHYCVPNIASRVPHTASYALSNLFTPVLLRIGEEGGFDSMLRVDSGTRAGVYIYNGIFTNRFLADIYQLPSQDLDLLLAAFH